MAIGNANVHNLGPDVNLQLQAGAAEPGVEEGGSHHGVITTVLTFH